MLARLKQIGMMMGTCRHFGLLPSPRGLRKGLSLASLNGFKLTLAPERIRKDTRGGSVLSKLAQSQGRLHDLIHMRHALIVNEKIRGRLDVPRHEIKSAKAGCMHDPIHMRQARILSEQSIT